MGRKRTRVDPSRPLPAGLYLHGKQYRAIAIDGTYVGFGSSYTEAMRGFAAWRHEGAAQDTVEWLLDLFTSTVCAGKIKAGLLSPRTASDYAKDAAPLKLAMKGIPVRALTPRLIAEYRDARSIAAPVHVRHELACLSAALSYAVERDMIPTNPAREVERPRKTVRQRLISDDEYLAVHAVAGKSVRKAMLLALRTCALPADLLKLGPRHILRTPTGRVLRYARGKTKVTVEVAIEGELARVIDAHLAAEVIFSTFVRREDGQPYTPGGLTSMFRRHCVATKVADFGLRDLRAKGATDLFRAGRPLQEIQALLGHKSVRTTEIYLKSLVPVTARPNDLAVVASVA